MSNPEPVRQPAHVGISESGNGRVVVTGELSFATAREARQIGLLVLDSSRAERIVIDCAAVTRADSAGLAVLLDWLAWGRRKSRGVTLENLPASLVAIARISEVDGLLQAGAGWGVGRAP
jgi:phospholipid transport system transporter-binding protein